jgi:dihydroorotate dehydrogenase
MYRLFFTLVLSRLDPEDAHTLAFAVIRFLPFFGIGRLVRRMTRPAPALSVSTLGLEFDSPFGVAAGFDKDGRGILGLGQLGFGHVEVGTVTAIPQEGNLRPRLFRLVKDRAVINRMGFNNHGATSLAPRLKRARRLGKRPIIGVNIGKSRIVELDDAIDDYRASARAVTAFADYLAVNVSSPNTPGLRDLQSLSTLKPLLVAVLDEAGTTPVLVKIAPDLSDAEAIAIARLAVRLGLAGIIATNTTTSRAGLVSSPALIEAAGNGGLSGAPLAARSLELLRLIRRAVPADFCVISVGGVETADDVAERIAAGATLVQGYTAFLYRGPSWAREINRGLIRGKRRA